MWYVALSLAILLVSRLAYRACFPCPTLLRDSNGHLLYVKEIRKNNYRIPARIERFMFDTNDYPEGFHKLVALSPLSLDWLRINGWTLSLSSDVLLLLLTATVIIISGGPYLEWLLLFPLLRLLWYPEDRAFQFGARAFGTVTGNLYLISAFQFVQTGHWAWAVAALCGFVLFSTSSKFAWQAAIFFTLILSLFLKSWAYILVFLGCFALSMILTRNYSLQVLLGLIRHSYFYKTHLLKTNWGIVNFYQEWIDLIKRFRLSRLEQMFYQNPLAKLFSNYPVSIPFLAVWASRGFPIEPETAFVLCGIILIPIIATEALKFWGEPDRYLEYITIPIFLYLSRFSPQEYFWGFAAGLVVGVSALLYQVRQKRKEKANEISGEEQYQELLQWAEAQEPSTFLTVIIRTSFFLGYFLDKHRYVSFLSNIGKGEFYHAYKNLCPDYGSYPGSNLKEYIEKYKVDFLVVSKKYVKILETKMGQKNYYDFSPYTSVYDSEQFIVYKTASQ